MNRREAYEYLKDYLDSAFHYSNGYETYCYLRDCADTLAPNTPDPETGLVRCGCGGKAEIRKWEWANDAYIAGCTVCDANVDFPYDIDETDKIISDWNRAMGRRTEK